MTWLPWEAVTKGGPWAILVLLCLAFLLARSRGIIASEKEVDRAIAGYVDSLNRTERELAFWRSAAEKKDTTIQLQAEQINRLLAHSDVSANALESILAEAKKRDAPS